MLLGQGFRAILSLAIICFSVLSHANPTHRPLTVNEWLIPACEQALLGKFFQGRLPPSPSDIESTLEFIRSVHPDTALDVVEPSKTVDYHFEKHRQYFAKIGIHLNSNHDLIMSAQDFGASKDQNRIVFKGSKGFKAIYKIDLNDGRVLILAPESQTLVSYFVKELSGVALARFAYFKCYLYDKYSSF